MEKFEYKTVMTHVNGMQAGTFVGKIDMSKIQILSEEELNVLGQQGWELIDTIVLTGSQGQATNLTLIFKSKVQ
jgi:hypothetical protein